MFSANITGQVQRVIYDNSKDGQDAILKITMAVPKQYARDKDKSKIFPLITIFGHDAAYFRKYAGVGQVISIINAEADYYKNDKFEDDSGNNPETVSFKAGRVMFPKADVMKALVEAGVAEEPEGGEEEEEESRPRKRRGTKSKSRSERRGTSSRRRPRDEEPDEEDYDEDDEEEEEEPKPRRKRPASKKKPASKKPAPRKRREEPEEDDDDFDDDYDDDDNYFDDED